MFSQRLINVKRTCNLLQRSSHLLHIPRHLHTVFFAGGKGRVSAINVVRGINSTWKVKKKWSHNIQAGGSLVHILLHQSSNKLFSISINPSVSDAFYGKVDIGTVTGTVCCLLPDTGQIVWTNTITLTLINSEETGVEDLEPSLCLSPDGSILVAATLGKIVAYRTKNGLEVWEEAQYRWLDSTPVFLEHHGILFVGSNGYVCAIQMENGKVLWQNDFRPAFAREEVTLCAYGDELYVGIREDIKVFDARTGKGKNSLIGNESRIEYFNAIAMLVDEPNGLLFTAVSTKLSCYELETRTTKWSIKLYHGTAYGHDLLCVGDKLFVGISTGRLFAVDKLTGKVCWERNLGFLGDMVIGSCDITDMIICAKNKTFYGLNVHAGQELWQEPHDTTIDCISTPTFNTYFNADTMPQSIEKRFARNAAIAVAFTTVIYFSDYFYLFWDIFKH